MPKKPSEMTYNELDNEDAAMTEAMDKLTPERVIGHPDVALTKGIIREYREEIRSELKKRRAM